MLLRNVNTVFLKVDLIILSTKVKWVECTPVQYLIKDYVMAIKNMHN